MRNDEIMIAIDINGEFTKENKDEKTIVKKYFCLLLQRNTTLKDLFYALYFGLEKDKDDAFEYFKIYIENYKQVCIEYNKINLDAHPIIDFNENANETLDSLGFVTGSCVKIQEDPLVAKPLFKQQPGSPYILEDKKNPLEFNINVRRINVIEDSKVQIIPPTERPQIDKTSVAEKMLPMILSAGAMIGIRYIAYPAKDGNSSMGNAMLLMSAGMAVVGIFNAVISEIFKKRKFYKNLSEWKENYENYINNIVIPKIQEWQESDIEYLNTTYPRIDKLFERIAKINEDVFSRSQNDNDFFRIRIGESKEIAPLFTIENQMQENIIYDISFSLVDDKVVITFVKYDSQKQCYSDPRDSIKSKPTYAFLPSPTTTTELAERNNRQDKLNVGAQYIVADSKDKTKCIPAALTDLPYILSTKTFKYLKSKKNNVEPPLLLDLRTSGALGVISCEYDILKKFIRNIIFELSYYHAPEDVQFVFFFNKNKDTSEQKEIVENYKFLPHTNELFDDLSQFIFDDESAAIIFTKLLSIMDERSKASKKDDDDSGTNDKFTQIVCVVFDDYDIKKTGFSKHLPEVPKEGEPYENKNGLTFIFLKHQKNDLPKYCGNIIELDNKKSSLRYNVLNRQTLNELSTSDTTDGIIEQTEFSNDYIFLDKSRNGEISYADNFGKAYKQLSSIYYTKISENGQVPNIVTLFDVLFKDNDSDEDKIPTNEEVEKKIVASWSELNKEDNKLLNNDITKNLCVAIGENEHGIVTLDLHEKADGPHMLTAGTTGSGKSETIITYLINLCYKFSPRDLQFLLVDMKGGGFSDRLEMLPHCVGAVTDTEGEDEGTSAVYMLKRFLATLNAEIKQRKIQLKKLGVDNIDDYIRGTRDIEDYVYNDNESILTNLNDKQKDIAEQAKQKGEKIKIEYLAHLVLVVDEFTELKRFSSESDDVDFIKEITTIARVGRTLGFHIILVSQNIEGAITDDIRVNSKARVCLKVATKEASKQMLDGRIDAAAPNMPLNGRAYLLVGTGSRFVYFQSAYTAANSNTKLPAPVVVKSVPNSGTYSTFYNSVDDNLYEIGLITEQNKNTKKTTQLQFIRDIIMNVAKATDNPAFKQSTKIFLPKLKSDKDDKDVQQKISIVENEITLWNGDMGKNEMILDLGKFDIPIVQKQSDFKVNLLESNIALFGLSMSGKTTLLEVLINALHMQYTANQEHIFILDFSNGLRKFTDYPLVAAYFDTSNEEYIKRMFNILEKRLGKNQEKLKTNYRDENPMSKDTPHTTFIIDNINAFFDESQYSNYHERFLRLCREGLAKGITIVMTASSTKGLNQYLAYFKQKIAFNLPQDVYNEIFNKKVDEIGSAPCHGYANVTFKPSEITTSFQMNLPYEVQCFYPAFVYDNFKYANKFKDSEVERYPIFPQELLLSSDKDEVLTFEKLNKSQKDESDSREIIGNIGLDYTDFMPIEIDLNITRAIAIYGKKGFGKTNLLLLLLQNIISQLTPEKVDIVYFDDAHKGLGNVSSSFSGKYTTDPIMFEQYLGSADNNKLTVFVVQNKRLFKPFRKDNIERNYFKGLIDQKINNLQNKFLFIFSDVPRMDISVAQEFQLLIQTAFLLDNIAEFISERGQKTVFGSMDVKELKHEYARCSLGDGYYYDIEADNLKKLKFIKYTN